MDLFLLAVLAAKSKQNINLPIFDDIGPIYILSRILKFVQMIRFYSLFATTLNTVTLSNRLINFRFPYLISFTDKS